MDIALTLGIVIWTTTAGIASIHLLLVQRRPATAFGWLMAFWLLPVLGAGWYLLFGVHRAPRSIRRRRRIRMPVQKNKTIPWTLNQPIRTQLWIWMMTWKYTHTSRWISKVVGGYGIRNVLIRFFLIVVVLHQRMQVHGYLSAS